jgi:hypothetical protein
VPTPTRLTSLLAALTLIAPPPVAAQGAQSPDLPDAVVSVPRSTWKTMTVALDLGAATPADTLRLDVGWFRMDGQRLEFTAPTAKIAPGQRTVEVEGTYRALLPPPTPLRVRLTVLDRSGRRVWRQSCRLSLVNGSGREAWAGDLTPERRRELSWRLRECAAAP